MHIEHLAIWVKDLEVMKDFYIRYFGAISNQKYENPGKKFASYFLTFKSGARLELMSKLLQHGTMVDKNAIIPGLAHFAISVGSRQKVVEKTDQLRSDGYLVESEPRVTGDGYFESIVLDPEGNFIEITV